MLTKYSRPYELELVDNYTYIVNCLMLDGIIVETGGVRAMQHGWQGQRNHYPEVQ
jgi:hypothetical protein